MDNERVNRLKKIMVEAGIDILLLRLPENVLYATGYWPVIGASLAVVPASGDAALIMPFSELDYAAAGWVSDKRTFRFINMQAIANPTAQMKTMLCDLAIEKGFTRSVVGYEAS